MNYQEYKLDVESRLGKAEYDFDRKALNESARLLLEFRGKMMSDGRAKKKQSESVTPISNDVQQPVSSIPEPKEIKSSLDSLSGLVPLESDLKEFQGVHKDLLRVYLVNQDISPKKLANSFGVSYQAVAGLLNSKAVMMLRAKYFHKQLDNNTKIGLLKLTEEADPKIVLAAAEYLKILHDKENEADVTTRLSDPRADKALRILGDWLAGECEGQLIIDSKDLD